MKTLQKLFITAVFLFSVFAVSLSIQPEQQVRAETSGMIIRLSSFTV
nr:hypothetical protein [Caldifermentibacillus hisashii]